ncbi:MAG TPA: 50S ribosomal protein L11, partial [Planctomycetes bacterium]|nr:50S ribosomal protein L11 [Planctomycetota bacterium]
MAKRKNVVSTIKLQVAGGQATPAPPVGPVLGQHGVNIGEFVQRFNAETSGRQGLIIPVVISVYSDRSFDFILKSPPAAVLIKKALGMDKAANTPGHETVGIITAEQVQEIVEMKAEDLNAASPEAAARIIEGTARSMGVALEGAMMEGAMMEGEVVEDSGEVVEDSGEVVEDSGEVVEDSGEVVEDSGEVVEDSGEVV